MVFANIKDAEKYYSLHPDFKEIFEFLRSLSGDNLPDGISGEDFKITVKKSFAETSPYNKQGKPRTFEAHRDFIDIHYCISGSEGFGYNDVSRLTEISEYNEAEDYVLLTGDTYKLVLHPGDFCIVYPEDAHVPMLVGDEDRRVLKAIVKVRVDK